MSLHGQVLTRISHDRIGEGNAVDYGIFHRGRDSERIDGAGQLDHLRNLVTDVRLVGHSVVLRNESRGANKKLQLAVVRSQVAVTVDSGKVIGYVAAEFSLAAQEDPLRGHEHIVKDGQRFDYGAAITQWSLLRVGRHPDAASYQRDARGIDRNGKGNSIVAIVFTHRT